MDKTEDWRRTFNGTADFGLDPAHAMAIDQKKPAIFTAGVLTDNPTGPDMFSTGLRLDGSDLPGAPLARRTSSAGVN